jgi:DnaD/phage-associated family protein
MASKYWIKLYHEILHDSKMGRLPDKLWRRCIELFLVAGEFDQEGYLPAVKDMAWDLRITNEELEQSLNDLAEFGIVALIDNRWLVVKFAERQAPVSSTERSKMSRKFNKEVQRNVAEEATENKSSRQRTTWMTEIYRDLPVSAGIYAIKCAGSGMVYIGGSINIQHRIRAHLSEMSIFTNHKMHKDFKEFGPESISVQVLEPIEDETKLREKEIYWINQYPFDSLYNTEATGKRNRYWPENDLQRNVAPDTESDIDINQEKEKGPPPKIRHPDFARVSQEYQQEIGGLSGSIGNAIDDDLKIHPADWIIEAMKRAALSNNRRYSYVQGILKNWQAIGGPQNDKPKGTKTNGIHSKHNTQRNTDPDRIPSIDLYADGWEPPPRLS